MDRSPQTIIVELFKVLATFMVSIPFGILLIEGYWGVGFLLNVLFVYSFWGIFIGLFLYVIYSLYKGEEPPTTVKRQTLYSLLFIISIHVSATIYALQDPIPSGNDWQYIISTQTGVYRLIIVFWWISAISTILVMLFSERIHAQE